MEDVVYVGEHDSEEKNIVSLLKNFKITRSQEFIAQYNTKEVGKE
jgi:hypothetical protein